MVTVLRVVTKATVFLLVLDMFAFALWALSGQQPVDDVYFGTITAHILKAILAL